MNALASTERAMPRVGKYAPHANRAELITEICERIAAGEPLAAICRLPHMPAVSAVWAWEKASPDVAEAIASARLAGYDAIAVEARDIVDGKAPVEGVPPDPSRDKARADVRLKLLAKWDPRRYGDAMQLRHADADGEKLDTSPLVREFLGLMAPAAPIEGTAIDVTPKRKGAPREAPIESIDDLI